MAGIRRISKFKIQKNLKIQVRKMQKNLKNFKEKSEFPDIPKISGRKKNLKNL